MSVVYLGTISVPQTAQRRIMGWLMNNVLETICKEVAEAYFEKQSQYIAKRINKPHKELSQGTWSPSWDSNWVILEFKSQKSSVNSLDIYIHTNFLALI
jgi:hypothetical protein